MNDEDARSMTSIPEPANDAPVASTPTGDKILKQKQAALVEQNAALIGRLYNTGR